MESIEIECICLKSEYLNDWYVIERAEHDGREWMEETSPYSASLMRSARISDACVEGYGREMLALADAIDAEGEYGAYRCAVKIGQGRAMLWSPRNSSESRAGVISLDCAKRLAKNIREVVVPAPARKAIP